VEQIVGGNGKAVFEDGNFTIRFPENIADNSPGTYHLAEFSPVHQLAIGLFLNEARKIGNMLIGGIQWIRLLR
jgi:hypothetical protein